MEEVRSSTATSGAACADIIRGITLEPPVIGRITAGHTVIRGDRSLPVRDDHFSITTLVQNKETRAFDTHPLQKSLVKGSEKLRAIPVRIAYNDVNLSLNNSFSAFDPKKGRALCVGNGERAKRMTSEGVKEIDCPRPENCAFAGDFRCKNFTRAYFRIEGQEDELGTFVLRSTSYNTVSRLGSRLNQLAGLTGGKIAGMPMMLVLKAKTTTQSMREPIYFADLETRPGMNLVEAVMAAREYQADMAAAGLSIDGLERNLAVGLANSAFADELEDADEWVSDGELVAAAGGGRAATPAPGMRGLNSLSEQLAAKARERAGVSEPAANTEDGAVVPEGGTEPVAEAA